MLISSQGINPDVAHPFEVSEQGYHALASGRVALLACEDYSVRPESITISIAEVLLATPSSAIMHFEPPQQSENILVEPNSPGIMMAANYHNGHSEGHHKIVLQDPNRPHEGQWLLWIPPGSANRTFYRRPRYGGSEAVYAFEKSPTEPLKINNYFIHIGTTDEAIQAFREHGFTFEDRVLGAGYDDPEYDRLRFLSSSARLHWDPLAEAK